VPSFCAPPPVFIVSLNGTYQRRIRAPHATLGAIAGSVPELVAGFEIRICQRLVPPWCRISQGSRCSLEDERAAMQRHRARSLF